MLPTLPIGPLRLHTYGLFLLIAYWVGLWLAARRAPRFGLSGDHIYNGGFFALLGGIVAARLGHVAAFWEVYRVDPVQVVSLSPAALLPVPGLIGALLVTAWYIRRHRLSPWAVADAAGPGLLLAIAIASIGAFLAGRTLGGLSALPWTVEAPAGVRRHPAALYEAVACLAWLGVVLWLERRGPGWPGRTALLCVLGFAALRLFLEPLRAESLVLAGGWRIPQLVALVAVALSGWWLGRNAPKSTEARDVAE
jgi:phosphatidylglycerol:prolipoprotein diacylglycerol transferase